MSDSERSHKSEKKRLKKLAAVSVIAKPLAGKKLTKRLLKLAKYDKQLKRGVKEVQKALRRKEKGLVVFGGDVSPVDVITHLPVTCEEAGIPYVYVPSREDLGTASQTKRPTSAVLITPPKEGANYADLYNECLSEVKSLPVPK